MGARSSTIPFTFAKPNTHEPRRAVWLTCHAISQRSIPCLCWGAPDPTTVWWEMQESKISMGFVRFSLHVHSKTVSGPRLPDLWYDFWAFRMWLVDHDFVPFVRGLLCYSIINQSVDARNQKEAREILIWINVLPAFSYLPTKPHGLLHSAAKQVTSLEYESNLPKAFAFIYEKAIGCNHQHNIALVCPICKTTRC